MFIKGVWYTCKGCGTHAKGVAHMQRVWHTCKGCDTHVRGVAHVY